MARTSKSGLEYFPMDIDIFNDIKIRKLIKRQGGKAVTVYALLLCNIYKDGYYVKWDKELPFICSELTGFDEAYIQEVINSCLSLGLFSKELFEKEQVLTSKGIQERYSRICAQCRRICNIADYSLIAEREVKPTRRERREKKPPTVAAADPPPRYEPYTLTLDNEIEALKNDECWLDQLQVLHHMDMSALRSKLDEFKVQCAADGKRQHQSLQDAKQHFNSWIRIVLSQKRKKDDENRPKGRSQRTGNILTPDETKTYGDSF
ncbi:MAG: DUF4373 domain-containing protein [Bacteroides sp.]|nr:DUF4373 domain-containing protein [Bacteroides sp.]